jgi:hypothetical protein
MLKGRLIEQCIIGVLGLRMIKRAHNGWLDAKERMQSHATLGDAGLKLKEST